MCTYQMTHWKHGDIIKNGVIIAHSNLSKKRVTKKGTMPKRQLKEFFGHSWSQSKPVPNIVTNLIIDGVEHTVTLIADANGSVCDIKGLNSESHYDEKLNYVPSDYEYAMNILRGRPVNLYKQQD